MSCELCVCVGVCVMCVVCVVLYHVFDVEIRQYIFDTHRLLITA